MVQKALVTLQQHMRNKYDKSLTCQHVCEIDNQIKEQRKKRGIIVSSSDDVVVKEDVKEEEKDQGDISKENSKTTTSSLNSPLLLLEDEIIPIINFLHYNKAKTRFFILIYFEHEIINYLLFFLF